MRSVDPYTASIAVAMYGYMVRQMSERKDPHPASKKVLDEEKRKTKETVTSAEPGSFSCYA